MEKGKEIKKSGERAASDNKEVKNEEVSLAEEVEESQKKEEVVAETKKKSEILHDEFLKTLLDDSNTSNSEFTRLFSSERSEDMLLRSWQRLFELDSKKTIEKTFYLFNFMTEKQPKVAKKALEMFWSSKLSENPIFSRTCAHLLEDNIKYFTRFPEHQFLAENWKTIHNIVDNRFLHRFILESENYAGVILEANPWYALGEALELLVCSEKYSEEKQRFLVYDLIRIYEAQDDKKPKGRMDDLIPTLWYFLEGKNLAIIMGGTPKYVWAAFEKYEFILDGKGRKKVFEVLESMIVDSNIRGIPLPEAASDFLVSEIKKSGEDSQKARKIYLFALFRCNPEDVDVLVQKDLDIFRRVILWHQDKSESPSQLEALLEIDNLKRYSEESFRLIVNKRPDLIARYFEILKDESNFWRYSSSYSSHFRPLGEVEGFVEKHMDDLMYQAIKYRSEHIVLDVFKGHIESNPGVFCTQENLEKILTLSGGNNRNFVTFLSQNFAPEGYAVLLKSYPLLADIENISSLYTYIAQEFPSETGDLILSGDAKLPIRLSGEMLEIVGAQNSNKKTLIQNDPKASLETFSRDPGMEYFDDIPEGWVKEFVPNLAPNTSEVRKFVSRYAYLNGIPQHQLHPDKILEICQEIVVELELQKNIPLYAGRHVILIQNNSQVKKVEELIKEQQKNSGGGKITTIDRSSDIKQEDVAQLIRSSNLPVTLVYSGHGGSSLSLGYDGNLTMPTLAKALHEYWENVEDKSDRKNVPICLIGGCNVSTGFLQQLPQEFRRINSSIPLPSRVLEPEIGQRGYDIKSDSSPTGSYFLDMLLEKDASGVSTFGSFREELYKRKESGKDITSDPTIYTQDPENKKHFQISSNDIEEEYKFAA